MPNNIDMGGFGSPGLPVKSNLAGVLPSIRAVGNASTGSEPVLDLAQTWSNSAVTFTGVKINITATAAAAASKFFDYQKAGTSILTLTDIGPTVATLQGPSSYPLQLTANGHNVMIGSVGYSDRAGITQTAICFSSTGAQILPYGNVLEQRNGASAQTFRVYGTYTDASNYVRGSLAATSTTVTLAAETAGTGTDNVPVVLTPAGTSQIEVGNGVQFTEMTAPSAPAANKVILFAQDNGAGKTQLMALFSSGAAQQVAIEP